MGRTGKLYEFFRFGSSFNHVGGGESGELFLFEPIKKIDFNERILIQETFAICQWSKGGFGAEYIENISWNKYRYLRQEVERLNAKQEQEDAKS